LKSCLRPRGARLENACAKCIRMWGSSSSHTDRQYCAVDSITASSTPSSRNHVKRRVQPARHRDESSPRRFLFRHTPIHDNDHRNFLVYVNPRDLHRFRLAWKRQNAREKDYTPSRATSPCLWQEWRDTDWFKTRVPDQTQKRPHFIKGVNRPSPSTLLQRTRTTQSHFRVNRWALGPWELKMSPIFFQQGPFCFLVRRVARPARTTERLLVLIGGRASLG
jgi:hypothetical protein